MWSPPPTGSDTPPQQAPPASADGTATTGATTTAAGAAAASGDASKPEPVFQPLSLQDIAVRSLSRHLDVFGRARYRGMIIPVDLFLRVLRAASSHERLHSAELMLRVVQNLPCLECAEVDEEYWKPIVALTVGASTCPISEPYPALVARLRRSKKALEAWVAARGTQQQKAQPQKPRAEQPSNETKGKKKKEKEKEKDKQKQPRPASSAKQPKAAQPPAGVPDADVQAAMRLLKELDRAPASTQLLSDTGLGAVVGQLSKLEESLAPAGVIGGAKALRKRWKALVQQEKENGRAAPPIPESGKKDAAATEEEEQKDDAMDPLSIGRRALRTTTWLGVYKFSLAYEAHSRAVVGKRALALVQGAEAGRPRTKEVAAWTGEDEERERRRAGKRPPPGNTERVKKLVKYSPRVMGPKEKPFGGLVMVKGTKKKLKVVG